MVKRESVTDVQGQQWVHGDLDADTYFAQAREKARQMAQQSIAKRLADPRPRLRQAR